MTWRRSPRHHRPARASRWSASNSFGLNRVVESRGVAILRHLPRTLRRDPLEPVIWPPGVVPEDWVSFRRSPDSMERPIEHVPLREIVNAMAASARAAAGMSVIELHREALAIFGGRRLTAGITERLDAALAVGVRARRVRVESDGTVVRC